MSTNNTKKTLVDIALGGCSLWRDADGIGYATLKGGTQDNYPLSSNQFRSWLSHCIYAKTKSPPRRDTLDEVVRVLEHEAQNAGVFTIGTRSCEHLGRMYLDLCDEARRVVEIDHIGWRFVAPPPVKFLRKAAMSALPAPETGGDLKTLVSVLNLPDENAKLLFIGFVLAALMPKGPYPLLVLSGEQGSGKTTAAKAIKYIVDPSDKAPLRSSPKDEPQLLLWAQGCLVLALDNLSYMPQWLSDCLCRLSTGGGHSVRKLYTDGDEYFLDAQRPVILTGIEDIANRGDLIDRSIIVQMPQITDATRMADEEVWSILNKERARILGAVLDAVSCALRKRATTMLPVKPRMADFALWVTAAESALGWTEGAFLKVYLNNRREAYEIGLDASIFYRMLSVVIQPEESFRGTATDLRERMRGAANTGKIEDSRGLPKSASKLSSELRRVAPALRGVGWSVNFPPRRKIRMIEIDRPCEQEVLKGSVDSVVASEALPDGLP